tara:strand:- start:204 stop:326 length:123 start_codon:yes stop_codon:yes gene_type:complete
MNDIFGAAIGVTLTLTILECGFWAVIAWIVIKKRNKYEKM